MKSQREFLSRVKIVLCRPSDPTNVGSVCRAMKTMGISRLALVAAPALDAGRAAAVAVHAAEILAEAERFERLEDAVKGSTLVAGTTRRWGKFRKYLRFTPAELAGRFSTLAAGELAVVFGNESDGLAGEELAACHIAVTVPTSPDFPSLNLSHAVQIVTYEIYRTLHRAAGRRYYTPIDASRLDSLLGGIADNLEAIGFFSQAPRSDLATFLRDILARASLSKEEAIRLSGIFDKIAGLAVRNRVGG